MRLALALALAGIGVSACGRCGRSSSEAGATDPACASACAALVSAGCPGADLDVDAAPRCVRACEQRGRELVSARCDRERQAYLGCVSTAPIDCESARCAPAVCIEHRTGISGCAAEHAAYSQCIGPCLHAGTTHVAERGGDQPLQVETARAGCAECPALASGAPPGSACQAPKVCAERCCTCPDGRARFTTRVCAAGSCARDDACSLARQVGPDPCAAQPR